MFAPIGSFQATVSRAFEGLLAMECGVDVMYNNNSVTKGLHYEHLILKPNQYILYLIYIPLKWTKLVIHDYVYYDLITGTN